MTPRAVAIARAPGRRALAAVLGAAFTTVLPPLAVGSVARGLWARALPALAGHGAAVGLFAALGALIRGGRPA